MSVKECFDKDQTLKLATALCVYVLSVAIFPMYEMTMVNAFASLLDDLFSLLFSFSLSLVCVHRSSVYLFFELQHGEKSKRKINCSMMTILKFKKTEIFR
jgi:hypothetical protein